MEHSAHQLTQSLMAQMQALGHTVSHPSELLHSLSNVTAHVPSNMTQGFEMLRGAVAYFDASPTNATLQLQSRAIELWHQTEAALQQLSDSNASATALVEDADLPTALDTWLGNIVRQSIMWPVPRWPLYLFMVGAMACLFFSAVCHLLACCNQHVSVRIWRLDYAGAAPLSTSWRWGAFRRGYDCTYVAKDTACCDTCSYSGFCIIVLQAVLGHHFAVWHGPCGSICVVQE